MKTEAIQKINKIGKISSVITLIAQILVGVGIVLSLVGAVICFVIPESLMKMSLASEAVLEMDYSALGVSFAEEELASLKEEITMEMADEVENDFSYVEVTQDKVIMSGDAGTFSFTMRDAAWLVVVAIVALVMTFVTLIFIGSLCKSFRDCQSPFEENVIKKMQNLAYALIPWTIISTVTNSITDSLTNNKLSLIFTVDFGVVLVVLIVLILVYIFKYGAVLQQESDETL